MIFDDDSKHNRLASALPSPHAALTPAKLMSGSRFRVGIGLVSGGVSGTCLAPCTFYPSATRTSLPPNWASGPCQIGNRSAVQPWHLTLFIDSCMLNA